MVRQGVAMVGCLVVLSWVGAASAQDRVPHYLRTPTLSPYVHMFRNDAGGVNRYFTFVRPQLDYERYMRSLSTRDTQLQRQLREQEAERYELLQELERNRVLQQRPSTTAQYRKPAAGFMNYSGYYPQLSDFRRLR